MVCGYSEAGARCTCSANSNRREPISARDGYLELSGESTNQKVTSGLSREKGGAGMSDLPTRRMRRRVPEKVPFTRFHTPMRRLRTTEYAGLVVADAELEKREFGDPGMLAATGGFLVLFAAAFFFGFIYMGYLAVTGNDSFLSKQRPPVQGMSAATDEEGCLAACENLRAAAQKAAEGESGATSPHKIDGHQRDAAVPSASSSCPGEAQGKKRRPSTASTACASGTSSPRHMDTWKTKSDTKKEAAAAGHAPDAAGGCEEETEDAREKEEAQEPPIRNEGDCSPSEKSDATSEDEAEDNKSEELPSLISSIQTKHYWALLGPLSFVTVFLLVHWNWVSMKLYKHA